jgi:hypothetical protein
MELLDLVEAELNAFQHSGRAIHLVHAERALAETQKLVTRTRKMVKHDEDGL